MSNLYLNMKRILALVGTVFSTLFGCTQTDDFDVMVKNTVSEDVPYIYADSIPDENNYVFLDAREQEEFEVSRIPGAIYVGYDNFDLSKLQGFSSNDTIVVYCSIGYRSNKIGKKLEKAGYKTVFNLYGGLFQWANDEHPMENDAGSTTKIHGYNKKWSKWVKKGEIVLQ